MLFSLVTRTLVIFILGTAVYVSFHWMLGDFYGERIALSLDQWNLGKSSPSEEVLVNHLEFSEQSIKWGPLNPRYKELKARLLILRIPYLNDNKAVFSSLDQMIDLHRDAVQERPQWPFSWANLAVIKGFKKQFDAEYFQALGKVVMYGPYEVGAIQKIVKSAANDWELISSEEKELIYQAIANGVEIDFRLARNLKKILTQKYLFLLDDVCNEVAFHSEQSKERLCN